MMTHGRVETPLGLVVDYCLLGLGRFFFGPRLMLPTFETSPKEPTFASLSSFSVGLSVQKMLTWACGNWVKVLSLISNRWQMKRLWPFTIFYIVSYFILESPFHRANHCSPNKHLLSAQRSHTSIHRLVDTQYKYSWCIPSSRPFHEPSCVKHEVTYA